MNIPHTLNNGYSLWRSDSEVSLFVFWALRSGCKVPECTVYIKGGWPGNEACLKIDKDLVMIYELKKTWPQNIAKSHARMSVSRGKRIYLL